MFHWVGLIFSLIDEFFLNVAALVNYTERVKVVIKFNNSSNYHKYLKFRLKNTSFYESRLR